MSAQRRPGKRPPSTRSGKTKASAAAPEDGLGRQLRLLEGSSSSVEQPPRVKAAAKAFVDAAVRGEDLSPHVPALVRCCGAGCSTTVRSELLKPLALHALRRGDRAMVEELIEVARNDTFWLRKALSFADANGARLDPFYDLVVPLVPGAGQDPFAPLDDHVRSHPGQLEALSRAVTDLAPRLLPGLVGGLLTDRWPGDHFGGDLAPALPFLFELLKRSELEGAAAAAMEAIVKDRDVDASAVKARLQRSLSGPAAFHAALLLAATALARAEADWSAVDRLAAHGEVAARRGALQALAWSWARGRHAAEITARLAQGLLDSSSVVRRVASEGLRDGPRFGAQRGELDTPALTALVRGLRSKELAPAVTVFLVDYIQADEARARAVLALLPPAPSAGGAAEVARVCQAVIAGGYTPPCPACRGLGDAESWGEFLEDPHLRPEPPEFRRLERVGVEPANSYATNGYQIPYRCPACGTWFNYDVSGWEFYGNSTFWTYTLKRIPAEEGARWSQAPWARAHDFVKAGDWEGLDRALLQPDDDAVRVETMKALEKRVEAGLDVGPLEARLRAFLDGPPALRTAGVRLLARQMLRTRRGSEVAAFLGRGAPEVQRGALDAVWWGATVGGSDADVSPCLPLVRPFLRHPDRDVRGEARAILATAGMRVDAVADTVADAAARLESDQPGERGVAASLLADAARAGADIRAALPGLAALQADAEAGRSARAAIRTAGKQAPDPSPLVATLVEHLRTGEDDLESIHALRELQEKGVDVAPAFEQLGRYADTQSWALHLLKTAVETGRDIAPAAGALAAAVDAASGPGAPDYPGWALVEVLAQHYARVRDDDHLRSLLTSPKAIFAEAAARAVRWAVLAGADVEALLILGRLQGAAPSAPPRASWQKGDSHIEVNEREILFWSGSGRDTIGSSESDFGGFLRDRQRLVGIADTFGAGVLAEVVAAVKAVRARRG